MTKRTQAILMTGVAIALIVLAALILLQVRVADYDARLYATMTAIR